MAFRRRTTVGHLPTTVEDLYGQLPRPETAPKALWLHQGDVLRQWQNDHVSASDVAIELPTGSGKTLVGGLVGSSAGVCRGNV
jgi:hypothetical protein